MKHSKNLKDVVSSFLFKSTLIFIALEIVMILIYFIISGRFTNQITDLLETNTYKGIINEVEHELELIDLKLSSVVSDLMILKSEQEYFFENIKIYNMDASDVSFSKTKDGMLYKTLDNGGSSLYISANEKITEEVIHKAQLTEVLDNSLKLIVENNKLIFQSYFNSYDNMLRLFPYNSVKNIMFPESFEVSEFIFYNLAIEENNPEKSYQWTSVYLDPAGGEWLLSCVVPIYNLDKLEGVSGVDITVKRLISDIMDMNLQVDSNILITDNTGAILAFDEPAGRLLDLGDMDYDNDEVVIDNTVYIPSEFNILNYLNDDKRSIISSMYEDELNELNETISFDDKKYNTLIRNVRETNWSIFIFTDNEKLNANTTVFQRNTRKLINIVTLALSVIFLIIYLLLHVRIRRMSYKISHPIHELSEQTKMIGRKLIEPTKIKASGIQEIDMLNHNFYKMVRDVKFRTDKIIEMEIEKVKDKEEIEEHIREATTDVLTNVYNRRKIEETLNIEISRTRRYGTVFSIILIDVDCFKDINDMYGHNTGDDILVAIANIINTSVRMTDMLARWGGDEFLIVTMESNEVVAYNIAEKIRKSINNYNFIHDINVTISIGVAEINKKTDSPKSILKKADISLYEAKKRGRNNVVKYTELINDMENYHESD